MTTGGRACATGAARGGGTGGLDVPAGSTKRAPSTRATTASAAPASRRRREKGRSRNMSPIVATKSSRVCDDFVPEARLLVHNDVDELARHDDRLPDRRPVQMRLHLGRRRGPRDELFLGQADVDLEPVAHLAVHLDDELERLALQLRLVRLRPGLLPQPLVAEPLPELLRDVGRVRLDQRDRGFGGEAGGRVLYT